MRSRLQSVLRIVAVERDLHRLEEHRLAALVRREGVLNEERAELLDALNDDGIFYGAFIYPMAKRLRLLDESLARVARDKDDQSRKVLEQGARKKRAERLHAGLLGEWERKEARRELMDLVEQAAGRAKTSLP